MKNICVNKDVPDISQPVQKTTQATADDSESSDNDLNVEENNYPNFKCRRQWESSMDESDIAITERQMVMRKSQANESDEEEISNCDTRGMVPFNSWKNYESMDDICWDDKKYVE